MRPLDIAAPLGQPAAAMMDRFPYVPLPERPKLVWPDGKRLAVWVLPNIEHYEYRPEFVNRRNAWPRMPAPDVVGYGVRDYGNRVGVWRMLDVFARHDIKATVSLNFGVIEHYPEVWQALRERGDDILCHGFYNTRYLWGLSEEDERAVIRDCVETYARATGGEVLPGWFGPAVSGTFNTADIVKELGISYTADYYHDEQPTLVRTKHGPLPCMPYSMEINDAQVYRWQTEGAEFARMIRDAFDTLYEEGAETGRVLAICLHPFLYGQPHRLKYLDEALAYVMSHEGVWQATGSEIADWAMREWLPSWALPVEDMPGAGA